jgi:RimJ/RimL family protein N-acetyltransferase
MDQPTLMTPRLVLRPFTAADAAATQHMAGDSRIASTTLNVPHPYLDGMAEAWIATHPAAWAEGSRVTFAITSHEGELQGAISLHLHPEHSRGELGYWIGQPYWSQGLATEAAAAVLDFAFGTLQLNRVQASHLPRNPASGRVLEKLGMQREGLHRERYRKGDHFEDVIEYAILRRDWLARQDTA